MNYPPHRTYPNKPGRRLSNNERIQRMRIETQNQQKEARMRHLREFRVNETYELQEKNINDPIKTAKRPRTDDTEPQSKRRRIDNSDSVVPQQNGGQVNEPEPCSGVKVTIATINGFITRRDAGFVIQELGYFIELEALRGNFRLQPLFKGRPWYRQGVLHIHCENDETVMWLCSVVDRLVLWNGLTLYVKQKCQETKMIRCGIPVPDKTEAQSIKRVLRYQNLWAEVQRWIFHDVVHQKVKTFFIVSIPEDLLTKIRKNDNKLFYKLGNINVLEQGPDGKYVIKNQNNDSQFQNIVPKLEPFEINNNFFNDDVIMGEEEDFSKDPVLSRDFAYWGKVF